MLIVEIGLTILYVILFLVIIRYASFFKIKEINIKFLSSIFIIKVLCGTILSLIYIYYYGSRTDSDILKYFDDSKPIFDAIYENPVDYVRMLTGIDADNPRLEKYYAKSHNWTKAFNYELYNDNRTIIRFNAFVRLFSFGYLNVHVVFMAFLSFIGLTAIFKLFLPYFKEKIYELIVAVYLMPSVLIWTSGVLKEGLVMCFLGLFLYTFILLLNKHFSFYYIILLIISFIILSYLKFYIFIALLPALVFLIWTHFFPQKKWLKFSIIHVLGLVFAFNSQYFTSYNMAEILSAKQLDFITFASMQEAASFIHIPLIEPNFFSIIQSIPNALINVIFRPHIFESYSILIFFAAFENLFILLCLLICIFFRYKINISESSIIMAMFSFVFILLTLSGLITPVMGALVRYKTPALPFMMIIILYFTNFKRFYNFIKNG